MDASDVKTLATWLAGEFDNQHQALDRPAWFVHLRLWHRPLPHLVNNQFAFFAEQANALYLDNPYRQRVFILHSSPQSEAIQVQYYALKSPDQFVGCGASPDRLTQLTLSELTLLPGCVLDIHHHSKTFYASPPQGCRCFFEYLEQRREVVLGFEARVDQFFSADRGVDPETGSGLWGALMGAYEFQKIHDFSNTLPHSTF